MAAAYSKTSPYHGTAMWGKFLDVWSAKTIPAAVTDAVYQIDSAYVRRPDLLAHDMYKDSSLWWVFAVRNPDVLKDPVFDFTPGRIIYVPTLATVKSALGI
jgi:hypothetical protein